MTQQLKIDSRVKILIENSIRTNQRSMFVVVGDTADYVVSCCHCYRMIMIIIMIIIIITVILEITDLSDAAVNVMYDYGYLCASK